MAIRIRRGAPAGKTRKLRGEHGERPMIRYPSRLGRRPFGSALVTGTDQSKSEVWYPATTTSTTTIPPLGCLDTYEMPLLLGNFDESFYLTSLFSQLSYNALWLKFDPPTVAAAKLELEIRARNPDGVPVWWSNFDLVTPDPGGGENLTGTLTGAWETVIGSKLPGPWSAVELSGLRLFMEEQGVFSTVVDLAGVKVNLYDAGDVFLESIYPTYAASTWDNIWRAPAGWANVAPPMTQWLDVTTNAFWNPGSGVSWNAGGWWDIGAQGPPIGISAIGKAWNDALRPLAIRIDHDDLPTIAVVDTIASAVRYGKRLNVAPMEVVDLYSADDWAQDLEILNFGTPNPTPGTKITKIEVLHCI